MVSLVKRDDADTLRSLLATNWISTNPSNIYGESLLSLACRYNSVQVLKVLLNEYNVNVSIADSTGRTCLHEACWNAQINWDVIELLLHHDTNLLFVCDSRGKFPLEYCNSNPDSTTGWIQYFDRMKDEYWPPQATVKKSTPPILFIQRPNSRRLPDLNVNPVSLECTMLAVNGHMKPDTLSSMMDSIATLDHNDDDVGEEHKSASLLDTTEILDGSILSRSGTSFNFDDIESEMKELLNTLDNNFRQLHFHSTRTIKK